MKNAIIFLLLFLTSFFTNAQQWNWASTASGSAQAQSVSTDSYGYVYVGGAFNNSLSFGATTLNDTGNNMFLAKYDLLGNFIWAKTINGAGRCFISADANGNVFLTGWFASPSLISGSFTLTNS